MVIELTGRLHAYLDGKESRSEFERWFYALAFDVHRGGDAALAGLVYAVEGILGEASSGGWSEAALKAELEGVLRPYSTQAA